MTSVLPPHASNIKSDMTASGAAMSPMQEPTPPDNTRHDDDPDLGPSKIKSEGISNDIDDDMEDVDDNHDNSSNAEDGPNRRRRRSRKGLDKKFECPHDGCGKSYSRAEHLFANPVPPGFLCEQLTNHSYRYRHQLNHNPKQIYKCDFPDCDRQFVRLDLCNRHRDRHTAKGSALSRRDSMIGHVSPVTDGRHAFPAPGSLSPEANRPGSVYSRQYMQSQFQDITGSPYTPVANTPPVFPHPNGAHQNGVHYLRADSAYGPVSGQQSAHHSPNGPQRPSVQTNVPAYGVLSPASQGFQGNPSGTPQSATPYSGQTNFPPFSLPPSNFQSSASSAATPREGGSSYGPQHNMNEYPQGPPQTAGEMVLLDNMTNQTTIPVFGSDSVLNKSPYVGMPEDFMAYLFNTQAGEGAPMSQMMPQYNQ